MRRSILMILWGALAVSSLYAQRQRPKNQPYADMKRYHFGFHVGMHTQDLILTHSGVTTSDGKMWFAEIPSYSPGFSVGVIGNLYVNQYLNLRFTPTVHFGDKKFTFIDARASDSHATFTTSIRSNYLTLPLDLKYTAMRLNNYRPYLLGGVFTAFDMGRKKETPVLLKPLDYGVEIGFGCDIYLPYFKLCPELKFCFGLADVLEKDRNDLISEPDRVYTAALSKATSRLIVLTFNFE